MKKSKTCILTALSLVAAASYGASDSSFKFENSLRVGFDDNVYGQTSNEQDTVYVSDLIRATFKANFSQRTEFLMFYSPEFIYRADLDDNKFVSYHDVYGRLVHHASQKVKLTVSDRFRYQDRDAQATGNTSVDRNFVNNDVQGALDIQVSELTGLRASAGYEVKLWDDEDYSKLNDYDRVNADFMVIQEVKKDTTDAFVGVGFDSLSYDEGNRGGFDTLSIYVGADHAFNPTTTGNIKLGYQMSDVESGRADTNGVWTTVENDSNTPYVSAGIEHKPSAKTTLAASMGYSMYASNNEVYSAQNRLNVTITAKQDLTAKISLNASLAYIMSEYEADYAVAASDADDELMIARIRASYEINRNNFIDAGYQLTSRTADAGVGGDYDRNQFDIGWRVSF
jgi:hypothetical protein